MDFNCLGRLRTLYIPGHSGHSGAFRGIPGQSGHSEMSREFETATREISKQGVGHRSGLQLELIKMTYSARQSSIFSREK